MNEMLKNLLSGRPAMMLLLMVMFTGVLGVLYSDMAESNDLSHPETTLNIIDVVGINLDGEQFDGSSLKGKMVLLDFWAVWCGPCLTAIPELIRLHNDYDDQDFVVLGIASHSGTVDDVKIVVERFDPTYPIIVAEPVIAQKFEIIGFPTYFLIDANGQVVKKYVGELKYLYDQIATDLGVLLGSNTSIN